MISSDFLLGYGAGKNDGGGGGGGGTPRSASGTFTPTGSSVDKYEIVHNLNNKNVCGMVWVEPNEDDEVVATQGYACIYGTFVSLPYSAQNIYENTTLVQNYTSSAVKTAVYPNTYTTTTMQEMKSTWSSKDAAWTITLFAEMYAIPITDNSIALHTKVNSGYFGKNMTYHWKIWALED